jgi:hypothetical protein
MFERLVKAVTGALRPDGQPAAKAGNQKARTEVGPDESIEDLYNEFCETFCFRPGENLMEYLRANGHTDLVQWFNWDTTEPEPKGLIRLFVGSTRGGHRIWEKQGISVYHDGGWDLTGGGPSEVTKRALAEFAKVIEKPITVFYREKPDGPVMQMVFQ